MTAKDSGHAIAESRNAELFLVNYAKNKGDETDDGGATGGAFGDSQHIDPFLNLEGIDGSGVVL